MSDNFVYNFQLFCISATVAISIYFFCKATCGTKHGIRGVALVILHWLYRFFFQEIFWAFYLGRIYGEESWFINGFVFLNFLEVILFMVVMNYVFKGSLVKILLYSFLVECVSTVLMVVMQTLVVGGIDFGLTHGNPGKYIVRILAGVLLAAIVYWSIYRLLYSRLIRLQSYEIKHMKFFGFLIMIEYLVSFASNVSTEVLKKMKFAQFMEMFGVNVFVIALVLLGVTFVIYRRGKKQKALLEKQLQSMQGWGEALSRQEEILFNQESEIIQALKNLREVDSQHERKEKLRQYIDQLKERYQKIQGGIYSSDRKIDAFLVTLKNQSIRQKMETQILFQGYQGCNLPENTLEQLVWTIYQNICQVVDLSKESQMTLRASDQGRYTIIWLKIKAVCFSEKEWTKQMKKCQKETKVYLKPHHGIMTAEKKDDVLEVKVMMGR